MRTPTLTKWRVPRRRRVRRARSCLAALLAALVCACAVVTNPVTGAREVSVLSPQEEVRLGQQAAEQVRTQIGLVQDPALESMVAAIGARLAAHSPRQEVPYHFAIADMEEPNAFALPGGWIYVSRGLLALTNSEAELANVIGHEVGHVAALHAAQRETRSTWVGLGTVLGTAVAGLLGGGQAAAGAAQLGQVVGAGLIASYSRDQERQADEVGQQIAADAGWDPAAMASFLRTLERWSTLQSGGEERMPSFLDSHPLTAERVQDTAQRAAALAVHPQPPVVASHDAFLARLDGLLVGPDPAEGVVQGGAFLHPGLDLKLAVPEGWRTANQASAFVAQAPGGDAVVVLEAQGPTGDPRRAAQAWLAQQPLEIVDSIGTRLGGWSAVQVHALGQARSGPVEVLVSWVAHPKLMLRLTEASPSGRFAGYVGTFRGIAKSLGPLSASQRNAITVERLRVVTARAGESLQALSRRTGNVWSVRATAVANALPEDARLAAGQAIKIAIREPYRGGGGGG